MCINYCNRYVQIELLQGSLLLKKVLEYAQKHFSQILTLSSSLLILDDNSSFKKDYLINWIYHAGLQEEKAALEVLLLHSALPIRIKILQTNHILHKVKVSLSLISPHKILLSLDQENRVAKRYLKSLFAPYLIAETHTAVYLCSTQSDFWANVLDLISTKVIHNVAIEFDCDGLKGQKSPPMSFLTQKEQTLRQHYLALHSRFDDDFRSIKKRYLKLAKAYHPDNVYGKDGAVIAVYAEYFKKINEAYQAIKKVHTSIL
ncbi:hypothetical protein BKH46_03920 [Helicobacter sp. 12S02634-8]|uniref:J domain-containing protein n=1 Tax=Helicobacter sp. 12S02634-8 TaxID=1476199 RepID=UPI000BA7B28E|nr:J domain-containing protein [Helicobacter sp. 12S02634-8]PAF47580.1 hypothetical protein BKH46_03920 [Helicobacter sp. 12S02634-8]